MYILSPESDLTLSEAYQTFEVVVEVLDQNSDPVPDGTLVSFALSGYDHGDDEPVAPMGTLSSFTAITLGGVASVSYTGPAAPEDDEYSDIVSAQAGSAEAEWRVWSPNAHMRAQVLTPDYLEHIYSEPNEVLGVVVMVWDGWGEPEEGVQVEFGLGGSLAPYVVRADQFVLTGPDGIASTTYTGPSEPPAEEVRSTVNFYIVDGPTIARILTIPEAWDNSVLGISD